MTGALRRLAVGLGAVLRPLERAAIALAIVVLLALLVLTNVEVAGRYFLGFSTLIADEYGGYAYSWLVLLGAIHLLRSDSYLTITLIIDRLPRLRSAMGVVAGVLGLGTSLILLWSCWQTFHLSWLFGTKSIQPSQTPLYLPQVIMPVGFLMLVLAYLEDILRRLSGLPPRRQEDDTATWGEGDVV
ncbi:MULTISPECIES: TRAP transporter small permease [unclassified Chelatococcus]|uniref:TRAP transporter small permease n=1 Tax=unclassified Chelatococcus TaxID=2638111 RepID=UPI001BD12B71|nr:TRAP transporter small permease [Chelatococcus sp.]MBS7742401.1 TRAP transporter small permease [Chelatococcus sp. HY11]CAH1656811.1 TRAP-type C4-dicarboxylate transport system permease small subunit [Hyphomicrobiales bacterium]MBX3542481.1 TRAP transporter small permease [Chelatococcus sp.]MCO5075302.1 TRAP transporter small permease [Chelatococcus sp.]CAH1695914.1 TRAP-type C4-dicarboxylate transport system permease small subunit [Hyphomicrobiales bacterium]